MKRAKSAIAALLFLAIIAYNVDGYCYEPPGCPAKAAILIEQSTGRVLFRHNADERLPMASITKIMTALVVLERVHPQEIVEILPGMSGIEGSSMYLEVGERLTVEDLLYGLMLRSGNDAAVALAVYVAGSAEAFAGLMNDRADSLGLNDTHFENPHGLPKDGHYTSAGDMAIIAAAAMEIDLFRQIVSTERRQVPWYGHTWDRVMTNKNKILSLIEGGNGIKTGYTKKAGRCLVASAAQEGMTLIAVTLNCDNDFEYCAQLLTWGFDTYDWAWVIAPGQIMGSVMTDAGRKDVVCAEGLRVPVSEGETPVVETDIPERISGPVGWGAGIGAADVIINGKAAARARLSLDGQVSYDNLLGKIRKILMRW